MSQRPLTPALTDEELLEKVVLTVMKWPKKDFVCIEDDAAVRCIDTPGGTERGEAENDYLKFRPLSDWNDTMQVAERAMERGGLDMRFAAPWLTGNPQRAICLAALQAVDSRSPKTHE